MNTIALIESRAGFALPAIIERTGKGVSLRFLEFFTVNIRNPSTRTAYGRAACAFLHWCEERGIAELRQVQPVHVTAYTERLGRERSAPTIKQDLACLRMLFDWLVTGQVMPSNPTHAVRGPRHSVSKGVTAVIPRPKPGSCSTAWTRLPWSACAIARSLLSRPSPLPGSPAVVGLKV